jgi:2-desacetyl-2-hydroxyethyl bacteriochlorophyllide A dehydrogenase
MAEYVSVPSLSLLHGEELSYDALSLVEPMAIGAHGIRRAGVEPGEFALVVGAGPIGLGTIELALLKGARVIALDLNETRLQFCKQQLKVEHIIHALSPDITGQLMEITGGEMPTVVIDATGSLKAINNAFQYLAHGGRYVLIGLQKGDISFSHPAFHKREASLLSSRNATREDFKQVIAAIKSKTIDPTNYITHRCSFNTIKDEFESWLDPANGVIKAMVEVD